MAIETKRRPTLERLAERLAHAWRRAGHVEGVPESQLPDDREEAYFVQDEFARLVEEPVSGWKAGATSPRMRELDGHEDLIPGRIFSPTAWHGGSVEIGAALPRNPRVETEFAFRLTRRFPPRAKPRTPEELAEAAVLHPALEIIGDRLALPDAPPWRRSLGVVADNGGGFGFVFGDAVPGWRGFDLVGFPIRFRVDGGSPAPSFSEEERCVPEVALADLVNHLSARGIAVEEGMFLSTGAATVPQPVAGGSEAVADFGELGSIRVRFK